MYMYNVYVYVYKCTLYLQMGKSIQYRNWAVTWNHDVCGINVTTRDGIEICVDGYTYQVYVGPIEEADTQSPYNHNHILVHCKDASVTKSKTFKVLQEYASAGAETVKECVTYCRRVDTSPKQYIVYAFKSEYTGNENKEDQIVMDTIHNIKQAGNFPTIKNIKRKLISDHGADMYNRKLAKITDTYVNETDIIDNRGRPTIECNEDDNIVNYYLTQLIWRANILNTRCHTFAKSLKGYEPDVLATFGYLISLIPFFSKRLINATDNIPSLYLYGLQGSGKSTMFANCKFIKRLATDATGVARFKLASYENAYLLDDVSNEIFEQNFVNHTVKQLCLGDATHVKIHGDTQEVRAFIIVTSNEAPIFNIITEEDPPNIKVVKASWKRRFIICRFSDQCAMESSSVDYNCMKLRDASALLFTKQYDLLQEKLGVDDKFLNMLKVYYNVAHKDYYEALTTEDIAKFGQCYLKAKKMYKSKCETLSEEVGAEIASKYYKHVNDLGLIRGEDEHEMSDSDE